MPRVSRQDRITQSALREAVQNYFAMKDIDPASAEALEALGVPENRARAYKSWVRVAAPTDSADVAKIVAPWFEKTLLRKYTHAYETEPEPMCIPGVYYVLTPPDRGYVSFVAETKKKGDGYMGSCTPPENAVAAFATDDVDAVGQHLEDVFAAFRDTVAADHYHVSVGAACTECARACHGI